MVGGNDTQSPEDDDEDLLRLSDGDENSTTVDIDPDNLDILKEIDSYINAEQDEGDETVLLAVVDKEKEKCDDDLLARVDEKEKVEGIDTNTSINFEPTTISTPHRPSTSKFSFQPSIKGSSTSLEFSSELLHRDFQSNNRLEIGMVSVEISSWPLAKMDAPKIVTMTKIAASIRQFKDDSCRWNGTMEC